MNLLSKLPKFVRGNKLKKIYPLWQDSATPVKIEQTCEDAGLYDANVITSEYLAGYHYPIIDLDMDAALLPSSTPGHHHLYIDKLLSYDQLVRLLEVMVQVGIVQAGILEGVKKRGYATLRLPHVKKCDDQPKVDNGTSAW